MCFHNICAFINMCFHSSMLSSCYAKSFSITLHGYHLVVVMAWQQTVCECRFGFILDYTAQAIFELVFLEKWCALELGKYFVIHCELPYSLKNFPVASRRSAFSARHVACLTHSLYLKHHQDRCHYWSHRWGHHWDQVHVRWPTKFKLYGKG